MRLLPAVLAILVAAAPASAEKVTYHLTGHVTQVGNGAGGTLDLTGIFLIGASWSFDLTVERSAPPTTDNGIFAIYTDPGVECVVDIGSWESASVLADVIAIENDDPVSPGIFYDSFTYQASVLSGPPFGTITPAACALSLVDLDGTALSGRVLPRPLPGTSEWEGNEFSVTFVDNVTKLGGIVAGTVGTLTTPAHGTTWGAIKAFYKR